MSPAAAWLIYGTPFAIALCLIVFGQKHAAARPAKTARQAETRRVWATIVPYSQLGVRVGLDGFIYANGTGKCLGLAAAASVTLHKPVTVTTIKPSHGYAVIRFADGTTHRHPFGLRNLAIAQTQADRFNQAGKESAQGSFRRTKPATMR